MNIQPFASKPTFQKPGGRGGIKTFPASITFTAFGSSFYPEQLTFISLLYNRGFLALPGNPAVVALRTWDSNSTF